MLNHETKFEHPDLGPCDQCPQCLGYGDDAFEKEVCRECSGKGYVQIDCLEEEREDHGIL